MNAIFRLAMSASICAAIYNDIRIFLRIMLAYHKLQYAAWNVDGLRKMPCFEFLGGPDIQQNKILTCIHILFDLFDGGFCRLGFSFSNNLRNSLTASKNP